MKFAVFAQGLSMGQGSFRPAMIFKDKREKEVLPIWLDQIDAGVLLASAQAGVRSQSAHSSSMKLFDALKINLKEVYFDEVAGNIQYATLTAIQGKKNVNVRVRASEALSLAINAGCTFYTDDQVIEKSRAMTYDLLLQTQPGAGHLSRGSFEGMH